MGAGRRLVEPSSGVYENYTLSRLYYVVQPDHHLEEPQSHSTHEFTDAEASEQAPHERRLEYNLTPDLPIRPKSFQTRSHLTATTCTRDRSPLKLTLSSLWTGTPITRFLQEADSRCYSENTPLSRCPTCRAPQHCGAPRRTHPRLEDASIASEAIEMTSEQQGAAVAYEPRCVPLPESPDAGKEQQSMLLLAPDDGKRNGQNQSGLDEQGKIHKNIWRPAICP